MKFSIPRYVSVLLFVVVALPAKSQVINWKQDNTNTHMVSTYLGWDYGLTYGLGYSVRKDVFRKPAFSSIDFSIPSGGNIIDDFKIKLSEQIQVCEANHFVVSARGAVVARRYQNTNVRLFNMGSELEVTAGYYKIKWFAAVEAGWEKAWFTHFKHSASFKESFPGIKDGWATSSTGGNFYVGVKTGYSFRQHDLSFKIGFVTAEDFKNSPYVPYYTRLGYNYRF